MRVVIAGSRSFDNYQLMCAVLRKNRILPTAVLSGCARGADALGERWAEERGVPVERYPADWERWGRSAGPRRNIEMLDTQPERIVVFWDGHSRGTKHLMQAAFDRQIPTTVCHYKNPLVEGK